MKVKELIEQLKECDPDSIVIMSEDGEGNGFSPLSEIDDSSNYLADSTWSGEVGLRELTPDLEVRGYSEEDILDGEKCVVLWPIN